MIQLFTDGGSRGNPGISACAFIIIENSNLVFSESKFLGLGTNNNAEYLGLLFGIQAVKNLYKNLDLLEIFMDSELIVRQIKGIYKVKDLNLKKLKNLVDLELEKINYQIIHIPRELNSKADKLVNVCLDNI